MGYWTKKSLKHIHDELERETHTLKRSLGPLDLTMLGIGAIIGAGLFSITGIAAADNAGPAILISFIIAGIGCTFAALCYSELATLIPISGSAYTYAFVTMGELMAWIIGWTLILEYAIGCATVSISWSAYFASLLHNMGLFPPPDLIASPWQPVHLPDGTHVYGLINLPALLIVVLISCILIVGIKESAIINTAFVIIKVSIVIVFIAIGIFYINPENYHPFIPKNTGQFGQFGWSGIMRAAGVVFFAYIGFDAVSTAAQETKNPSRTLPIGIIGSLSICTVLYILFAFVMTGLVNYKALGVAAPVALAVDKTPFMWLNTLVKLAIIASFISVMLVCLLGQSRIFYAMAKDGLLPESFAVLHRKFHTPWRCNLILMAFVSLFSAFAPLSMVGHMTSIGTLLSFVMVCAGVLVMQHTHPEWERPFRTPWMPFVPIMGILSCLLMMFSLDWETWARLIIWLAIGMIIYLFWGKRHSHPNQPFLD